MPVTDRFGRKQIMRVRVDIDEKTLQEVAKMTGATYFRATDTASLEKIYEAINTMETTTKTIRKFENYHELFAYLVAAALLVLGLDIYRSNKRIP